MPDSAQDPIFYDSHMHTPLCKHAHGEPEEYAEVGKAAGLKGVIFTCHSPMPDNFWPRVRMSPEQFEDYKILVDRARDALAGEFDVLMGIEADFFPGTEAWMREFLESAEFHYVLGSVHFFSPEYMDRYFAGDIREFRQLYFQHIAESAETGLFDSLAHPDLIKNSQPQSWKFGDLEDDIGRALDRVAKSGVAMELNTSGMYKNVAEMNPGPEILRMMRERGIPVVLGSDSHTPQRVAENFRLALSNIRDAGYTEVSVFRDRERRDLSIDDVESSLMCAAESP